MKKIQKKQNERETLTEEGKDDLLVGVRCKKQKRQTPYPEANNRRKEK